ncbi:DNA polymerase III subunit delta' [Idiomarina xiamenensis]|uniref:DNA-directed DNA polymerase n=1 Tax=Idiomarina xiamenensis 10-D-4 TaxID=740709 RepID=K2JU33_9GAMM|nr:DNA polymerase III subunit delta' [Idiomarina xiamenensis]EKE86956.1 DNA polymerase III subunit delta' [Idiomarina xiamenensis 10-D-4]
MRYPWLRDSWQQLMQALQQQRLAHAIGILWQPELATDNLLQTLSQRLLCLTPKPLSACGKCKSCQLFQAGTHPDFYRLGEADARIGVDDIRQLSTRLSSTANQGQSKVALLMRAEQMTDAAANALLKTLEEPTDDTYIVVAPSRYGQLLPTIASRLQRYQVQPPKRDILQQWLAQYSGQVAIDESVLQRFTERPLAALAYLQQSDTEVTDHTEQLLLALVQQQPWPTLNDREQAGDWLQASIETLQELVRVSSALNHQQLRYPQLQTAIKQWLIQAAVDVDSLQHWLHQAQQLLRWQHEQKGLAINLLLQQQWLTWQHGQRW